MKLTVFLLAVFALTGCGGGGTGSGIPKNVSPNEATKVDLKVTPDDGGINVTPSPGKKK